MKKHSVFGIISFLISVPASAVTFLTILIGGYIEFTTLGGIDENSQTVVIIGAVIMAMLFLNFIGAIFGIIGLFEKKKAEFFSVIGIALNSAVLLGTIFLVILGNNL